MRFQAGAVSFQLFQWLPVQLLPVTEIRAPHRGNYSRSFMANTEYCFSDVLGYLRISRFDRNVKGTPKATWRWLSAERIAVRLTQGLAAGVKFRSSIARVSDWRRFQYWAQGSCLWKERYSRALAMVNVVWL